MSRTLWLAYLVNIGFFVLFFFGSQYQFDTLRQSGLHLTWTTWNFYSYQVWTFNYSLPVQSTATVVTPTSDIITYTNIPSLVFWMYFFVNMGFLHQLRKEQNKQTKPTT